MSRRAFHTFLATWMLILELGQVIDVLVDDDVEVGRLVMRCNIALREGFGHRECV